MISLFDLALAKNGRVVWFRLSDWLTWPKLYVVPPPYPYPELYPHTHRVASVRECVLQIFARGWGRGYLWLCVYWARTQSISGFHVPAIMTFAEVPVRTTYEYVELSTLSGSRGEKTGPKLPTHKADSGYSSLSRDAPDSTVDYEHIVLVPGERRTGDERRFSLEERLNTLQEVYRTGRVPPDCSTEMPVASADDTAVSREAGSRVEEKPKRTSLTAKQVQE